jgi:hypothetical protein
MLSKIFFRQDGQDIQDKRAKPGSQNPFKIFFDRMDRIYRISGHWPEANARNPSPPAKPTPAQRMIP